MDHISDSLANVFKGLEEKDTNTQGNTSIEEIWPNCVGEKIAAETKPYYFRDGLLRVHVRTSVWVYELTHKYKQTIRDRLNETLGTATVNDIYFRVGQI